MSIIIDLVWEGQEKIVKALKEAPEAVKLGLSGAIQYLRTRVVERTPWVTGRTASAWSSVEPIDGGYSFGHPMPHIMELEYGYTDSKTKLPRSEAGPQTVLFEGRVYSRQAVGGIIGPLVRDEAVKQTVIDMAMRRMIKALGDA
jgi:hypothetical protein